MPSYFQTCRSNNARLRQPCLNGIVNFELDSFDHYMLPRVGRMALLPTTQPRKLCTIGTVRFSNSGSPDLNLMVFVPDYLNSCTYRCFSLCDMIPHVTQKSYTATNFSLPFLYQKNLLSKIQQSPSQFHLTHCRLHL